MRSIVEYSSYQNKVEKRKSMTEVKPGFREQTKEGGLWRRICEKFNF